MPEWKDSRFVSSAEQLCFPTRLPTAGGPLKFRSVFYRDLGAASLWTRCKRPDDATFDGYATLSGSHTHSVGSDTAPLMPTLGEPAAAKTF
jgi:hypothetical protein